ncbi:hypothetical protein SS50377_27507 [Spironucleus salmonicida]|uniref:RING-type domain-containing protein n=1 Tax=Spironucleus salmonicida TaxID=348837 RepID=V6LQP1_9EUKA|nr:hypothetical protein SS50377_27507 [Spironucleus salmonicida]|eukprot:EST46900.1 Hypothetical protein SS50377_13053 [Spironucleus salmonicida]
MELPIFQPVSDNQVKDNIILVTESNNIQYTIYQDSSSNNDFVITVFNKQNTIAAITIKPGFFSIPNVFKCSQSGYWLALSFMDQKISKGEFYLIYLNSKSKLVSKKVKQHTKPITAFNFINNFDSNSTLVQEKIEQTSPEFLFGNSLGEVFGGQYMQKEITINLLKQFKAADILTFRQLAPNRILNIQSVFTQKYLFIIINCGLQINIYKIKKQSILISQFKSTEQDLELASIVSDGKIPTQFFDCLVYKNTYKFLWLTNGGKNKQLNFHELKINLITNECSQLRGNVLNKFSDGKLRGFQAFNFLGLIYTDSSYYIIDLITKQIFNQQDFKFKLGNKVQQFAQKQTLFVLPKQPSDMQSINYVKSVAYCQISFKNEQYNSWSSFLYINDYENALKFSQTDQQTDTVYKEYAIHLIDKNDLNKAAQILALTKCNFIEKYQELISQGYFILASYFIEYRIIKNIDEGKHDEQLLTLLSQVQVDSIIRVINSYIQQQNQKYDLNKLYGTDNLFQFKVDSMKQMEIEDILYEWQNKLRLLLTNKNSSMFQFLLQKVIKNMLLNANLENIYAEFCMAKELYEYPIQYYLKTRNYDLIIDIYRKTNIDFIFQSLDQVISHKQIESFDIIQRYLNDDPINFPYNQLITILKHNQHKINEQNFVKFSEWYSLVYIGKNSVFIHVLIQMLQQLRLQDIVVQIINTTPVLLHYQEILIYSQKFSNLKIQIECLLKLNKFQDALELQFQSFRSIDISEIKHIEEFDENQITFGKFDEVFISFNEVLSFIRKDKMFELRQMYIKLFTWYINIEIVNLNNSKAMFQVRYKQLQMIFIMISQVEFLRISDGIKLIPKDIKIGAIMGLVNKCYSQISNRGVQIDQIIDDDKDQCNNKENNAKLVVFSEKLLCQKCGKDFSKNCDVAVFPCTHCWHKSCLSDNYDECKLCNEQAIEECFNPL